MNYHRRKFRSQSSDNMDRWKSRGWKRQRREEKRREEKRREEKRREEKREDQRRERVRRKKMQVREKVKKSRNTVEKAPEGQKVGSLKRRVRSHLAGWEMKTCTLLWREAHLEVKMYKTPHVRTTFGSWDIKKVHAVLARSTFPSQNVQNTPTSEHFWKLTCWKSARRCGAKHISKSKCTKHTSFGSPLEVEMPKKCTPLWREAHFEVKCEKHHMFGPLLDVQMSFRVAGAWGYCILPKVSTTWGFCSMSKTMAGVGHLKRICKDAFSLAGAVQETCSSELLGGPGAEFLRGVAFWSIRSSGLLRWFCVTGAALRMTQYSLFRGRRSSLDRWTGKIVKRIGTRPSALTQRSIFEGILAELLRFWCCQLKKLRKSRIASFLTLSR